ncbi:carbohydrate esterase family 4 protein [Mixia osmundae IAM 14324]|uniref:NodB homology domain-containing protein n=1 Tax=Mixia osmundae (strain CBS 9802 / IAM 14324 / JCM 22182 / KY 12970) TaxID=764103 RepID=G7E2Z6_MIXOS|nr:carbohydrate esterase family 4 protein [Mixia osmundae IAM 14324]KEI42534.1 carbohydrate esterase family 4 protein [Mixia osmundae IAM 14324]GAA97177.1 hypothetical protein E5Q_03853 [Mixia osmundae IAM 14324]
MARRLLTLSLIALSLSMQRAAADPLIPNKGNVHPASDTGSRLGARRLKRGGSATVYSTCTTSGTFALTYDDGPYLYESKIVSYLNAHNVKASFFLNGNNYGCIYDQADSMKAAFQAGHLIGSHTWTHADITKLSASELNKQLDLVENAFRKILGIKPKWFRPPYGAYNQAALDVLGNRGYSVAMWSLDSGDSTGASPASSDAQFDSQANQYPSPGIALSHETLATTAGDTTEHAVTVLQKAGYRLVSVPECLGMSSGSWYEVIGAPGTRDNTWTCEGTPAG